MKKSFFQILKCLGLVACFAVAVSSCKDTNEDLYYDLKLEQVQSTDSLNTALVKQEQNIEVVKDSIESILTQLEAIKGCECDSDVLKATLNTINDSIASLTAKLAKAASAKEVSDLTAKIDSMNSVVATLASNISTIESSLANTYVAKTELTAVRDSLVALINGLAGKNYCDCPIDSICGVLATVEESASSALSKANDALSKANDAHALATAAKNAANAAATTASEAKELAETVNQIATLNSARIDTLKSTVTTLNDSLVTLQSKVGEAYRKAVDAYTKAESNKLLIDNLTTRMTAVEGTIDTLKTTVSALNSTVETHKTDIAGLKSSVTNLTTTVDNLDTKVRGLVSDVSALQNDMNDVKTDLATKITADEAQKLIDAALEDVKKQVEKNKANIAALKKLYLQMDKELKAKIEEIEGEIEELQNAVAENTAKINTLWNIMQDVLAKQVTGIIIQGTHNPAFGSLTLPTGTQTNMLVAYYGEPVNDVYFPTYLSDCYADAKAVKSANQHLTANDLKMLGLTDAETLICEGGEALLSAEAGNAGTLYLTVNPNSVDYQGLKLSIENTQGVESAIKLEPLAQSDETLGFGYTRAAANGFYEAKATLSEDDVNNVQKVSFHTDKIKDAVKEIYQKRTNASLSVIANDLYDVITGLNLDRNAVKCEWTDSLGTRSVYSSYNLAATAVKPLGFGFGKDFNFKTLPGFERANSLIDRVAKTAKDKIHVAFNEFNNLSVVKDIEGLKIEEIKLKELSEDLKGQFKVTINKEITIEDLQVELKLDKEVEVPIKFDVEVKPMTVDIPEIYLNTEDKTGVLAVPVYDEETGERVGTANVPLSDIKINGDKTATVGGQTIKLDKTVTTTIKLDEIINIDDQTFTFEHTVDLTDAVEDLWGEVKGQIEGVNDMLADLNRVVDDANDLFDKINNYETSANNLIDRYTNKIKDYLDKINKKVVSAINNVNSRLQPVMFVSNSDGFKTLSSSRNYPTVVNGASVTFAPTTWTMELAVPVCRKHVAVTNVFKGNGANAQAGDEDCKAALVNANKAENLNVVLDGDNRSVSAVLERGYIYEVAYSALDYSGKIATRKYYVRSL